MREEFTAMNWILAKLAPVKPKALGPFHPADVLRAEADQERRQNDAMPEVFWLSAESWIRNNRPHPKVPLSKLGGAR